MTEESMIEESDPVAERVSSFIDSANIRFPLVATMHLFQTAIGFATLGLVMKFMPDRRLSQEELQI